MLFKKLFFNLPKIFV